MDNQLAILGKSLLFSEQIRRENGCLHTTQRKQATTIETFRTKHEQQEHIIETLKQQIAAVENEHAQLNDKIDTVTSEAARSSATQAALLQMIADLNKDSLTASIRALLEQNKAVKDSLTNVTNIVVAVQERQNTHEQELNSLSESVREMQTSKDKVEREAWGLGNRITNLSTECTEMKELADQVKTGMLKLDGFVKDSEQKSEQAIAIARSVQHGQVKLVDEVGRLERSLLNRQSTLTSDMARLEPEAALNISSAQLSRVTSGNAANSKSPRSHKQDPRSNRAATVDSQTTMSHLDDEEDILPSSPPIIRPEPARVVHEKAKTLATPFLTPGRQTRSQARSHANSLYQTRSATKPPFASSIPQPSAQSSSGVSPKIVTRSQAKFAVPPTVNTVETQTPDNSSSSVPSLSSLFAQEEHGILQDESLVTSTTSKTVTGTTPLPISPKLSLAASTKRKLDDLTPKHVEPETEVRPSKKHATVSALAGMSEKPVPLYALQMGRNGKPVVPTKPYKQNRRINIDDW